MSLQDPKAKKRKPNEPPAKLLPPAKKAAVSSAPSVPKPVKKEAKPSLPAVKDSRSDSSFFSAPKPKPKLPSFKRAPAPVKKELDPNVAQPSSIDPFQEALKSMGKARKESPAAPTPPATHTPPAVTVPGPKTKRKTVTWAPDSQLESIRLIERAVYDDDPVDVSILLRFFLYNTLMSHILLLFIRVYILLTVFVTLTEVKVLHCMPIFSKNS